MIENERIYSCWMNINNITLDRAILLWNMTVKIFYVIDYMKIYGRRMTNDEHNLIKIIEFQMDQKVSILKDLKYLLEN
jgi:hypothetical protein